MKLNDSLPDAGFPLPVTVIVWCKTGKCLTEMLFLDRDIVCFYGSPELGNTCSEGREEYVELPLQRVVRPLYGLAKQWGWTR